MSISGFLLISIQLSSVFLSSSSLTALATRLLVRCWIVSLQHNRHLPFIFPPHPMKTFRPQVTRQQCLSLHLLPCLSLVLGTEMVNSRRLDFNKLSTPIKSVAAYPDVPAQCARFTSRGWSQIEAQSLWSAWNDDYFLSVEDRRKLDEVEPFDEWEEFCLFASHYLILHAANYSNKGMRPCLVDNSPETPSIEATTTYKPLTGHHGLRRFGAAMATGDSLGRTSVLNCMGLGPTTRLPSYDIYKLPGSGGNVMVKPTGPCSRMCHTLTDLGTRGTLLIGGRNSPSRAKNDCWLFSKDSRQWERTKDLPDGLYRHAVCRLSGSAFALLIGGKSGAATTSSAVMIFDPDKGWMTCEINGTLTPRPVFGAMLTCSGRNQEDMPSFHGFLIGGMSDGAIQGQILAWDLILSDHEVGGTYHKSTEIWLTRTDPFHYVQAG